MSDLVYENKEMDTGVFLHSILYSDTWNSTTYQLNLERNR